MPIRITGVRVTGNILGNSIEIVKPVSAWFSWTADKMAAVTPTTNNPTALVLERDIPADTGFWNFTSSNTGVVTPTTNNPTALVLERDIPADTGFWNFTSSNTGVVTPTTNNPTYSEE